MRRAALALCLLLPNAAVRAEVRALPLDPAHAEVAFRAYALGIVPIDGQFGQFQGELRIDPDHPAACHVSVTVAVSSLQMADVDVRADVLSPALLDPVAFPRMGFDGDCRGSGIDGVLTLHGVARPLRLKVTRERGRYSAQASLRRAEWGITGRQVLAGGTVRIRVSTNLSLR